MNKNNGCLHHIGNFFYSLLGGIIILCIFAAIIQTPKTWKYIFPIIIIYFIYRIIKREKYRNVPDFDNMSGTQFEDFCCFLLSKNGYTDIKTTKASGDQGIDILAKRDGKKIGIQCKCYSSNIGNSAIQQAFSGSNYYCCDESAVITNRFFTKSAIDLSETTGVLLWDRNMLNKLISQAYKTSKNKNIAISNNNFQQETNDSICKNNNDSNSIVEKQPEITTSNYLKRLGENYTWVFKEFRYSDVELLDAKENGTGYEFVYQAESREQLDYILAFENEFNSMLEDTVILNKLYDKKFILKVIKKKDEERF